LGLTTGPVPSRVEAPVKAGLLALVDHAVDQGWPRRRACTLLGVDEDRLGRWQTRRDAALRAAHRAGADPDSAQESVLAGLADATPGGHPLHGLLPAEHQAILALYDAWSEIDRSHRKLAHRGSRLDLVYVSESTVRRVLAGHGLVLTGPPPRPPRERSPWPDWLEWKPNRVWGYDFTHFTRAKRAAIAILDIVSRKWITTLVSPEESSTQVEVCFLDAIRAEGLTDLIDEHDGHVCLSTDGEHTACYEQLRQALLSGKRERLEEVLDAGLRPLLLTISDNGPQMRSHTTREFLAGTYIAQQFGRPGVPQDQAWIETLFGHVKGEWPHLEAITDPGVLEAELDRVRLEYNSVRLHASLGYVTPDDEHEGRGEAIRRRRDVGLALARQRRLDYRRAEQGNQP
jgi:transposase InsO family protein